MGGEVVAASGTNEKSNCNRNEIVVIVFFSSFFSMSFEILHTQLNESNSRNRTHMIKQEQILKVSKNRHAIDLLSQISIFNHRIIPQVIFFFNIPMNSIDICNVWFRFGRISISFVVFSGQRFDCICREDKMYSWLWLFSCFFPLLLYC